MTEAVEETILTRVFFPTLWYGGLYRQTLSPSRAATGEFEQRQPTQKIVHLNCKKKLIEQLRGELNKR